MELPNELWSGLDPHFIEGLCCCPGRGPDPNSAAAPGTCPVSQNPLSLAHPRLLSCTLSWVLCLSAVIFCLYFLGLKSSFVWRGRQKKLALALPLWRANIESRTSTTAPGLILNHGHIPSREEQSRKAEKNRGKKNIFPS